MASKVCATWIPAQVSANNVVFMQLPIRCLFSGEVMTLFNHVMIPTRGNWFQTNSLDYDLDNRAGWRWFSLFETSFKDIRILYDGSLHQQIVAKILHRPKW